MQRKHKGNGKTWLGACILGVFLGVQPVKGVDIQWLEPGITPVGQTWMESYSMPHFSEGLLLVTLSQGSGAQYAYMNQQGEFPLGQTYLEGKPFREGLAPVKVAVPLETVNRLLGSLLGEVYQGEDGTEMVERYGFIDTRGNMVIPPICLDAYPFSQGLAAVELLPGKWGYLNQKGDLVVPPQYDLAQDMEAGYAVVALEGRYGLIDTQGQVVIPLAYTEIGGGKGVYPVSQGDKFAYYSVTNGLLGDYVYDTAGYFSEGFSLVEVQGKWGYVNSVGQLRLPTLYSQAFHFQDSLAWVRTGATYGYIDPNGKIQIILPATVTEVLSFSQGYARGKSGIYYGFFDRRGEEILPYQYRDAVPVSEGVGLVYDGSRWGLFRPQPVASQWALPYLQQAQAEELIPASSLGIDFTQAITRTDFIAFILHLYESKVSLFQEDWQDSYPSIRSPFLDTQDPRVVKAYELGLASGMGEGIFGAYELLDRESAAVLLCTAYQVITGRSIPQVEPVFYEDGAEISHWAQNSVAFLSRFGVVSGMEGNQFCPKTSLNTEQAVVMVLQLAQNFY